MALRAAVRFKAGDIWDTPEDGNCYEVIDGELFVSPPPRVIHQGVSGGLHSYLGPWVRGHRLGKVFAAPIGLVLDEENGLQPDLVYVSRDRQHIIGEKEIDGAPDLVVEILSPSTRSRDYGIKMRRYAAAGVPHYWIVDPTTRALTAYRLTEHGYEPTGTFGPNSVFEPEIFPGLQIAIDDLWS